MLTLLLCACSCDKTNDEELLTPANVSNSPGRSECPSLAVDSHGRAYLAWSEVSHDTDEQGRPLTFQDIMLATKPQGGSWTGPLKLTKGDYNARRPSIAVDVHDVVHLAWQQWVQSGQYGHWAILYMRRASGGTWVTPDTITLYNAATSPTVAVDRDADRVHIYWTEAFSTTSGYTCYACKPESGAWQDFRSFPFDSMYPFDRGMQTDARGGVHIVGEFGDQVFYRERKPDGQWDEMVCLTVKYGTFASFVVGDSGAVRAVWTEGDTCYRGFAYKERSSDGVWQPTLGPYRDKWKFSFWGSSGALSLACVEDRDARLHVLWQGGSVLGYAMLAEDTWSEMEVLAKPIHGGPAAIAAAPDGSILYGWATLGDGDIFCVEHKP